MIRHTLVVPVLLLTACHGANSPIVIDGQFDDWANVAPVAVDPTSPSGDAPGAYIDLGDIRVTHDAEYVHLLLDVGNTVNVQRLDGTAVLVMDADGDPTTGETAHGLPGADVLIDFTPPNRASANRDGMGMGVRLRDEPYPPPPERLPGGGRAVDTHPSPYDIGLAFAPTSAHRLVELRIQRGSSPRGGAPILTGDRFSARLVYLGPGGDIVDETDAFTYELTPSPTAPAIEQSTDPLARGEYDALRIMTYNVLFGSIFKKPEAYARVINAVNPDAIVFQELVEENSHEQLLDWLNTYAPDSRGRPWTVIFGKGGGPLRSAVAVRGDLEPIAELDLIARPDRDDRSLRVAAGMWNVNGKRVLLTSAHFKCCGRIDSSEDITRRLEMEVLNEKIRAIREAGGCDAVIVAGDYNLVGSGDLLGVMAAGLDAGGSPLTIANPRQLDGRSNATWFDPSSPFVPGRLDYLLYSDSSMDISRSFVLDTPDLADNWLAVHGLQATDTAEASDHLPLVVDVVLTSGAPRTPGAPVTPGR